MSSSFSSLHTQVLEALFSPMLSDSKTHPVARRRGGGEEVAAGEDNFKGRRRQEAEDRRLPVAEEGTKNICSN